MKCIRCNSEIHNDFIFCPLCGIVVNKDFENITQEGISCFFKSKNGDKDALNRMGLFCYQGKEGFSQDFNKAFEYFAKSAQSGCVSAIYNLAVCYYLGKGVDVDKTTAKYLFIEAKNKGHAKAENYLNKIAQDEYEDKIRKENEKRKEQEKIKWKEIAKRHQERLVHDALLEQKHKQKAKMEQEQNKTKETLQGILKKIEQYGREVTHKNLGEGIIETWNDSHICINFLNHEDRVEFSILEFDRKFKFANEECFSENIFEKNKKQDSCLNCKFAKRGECFPQSKICSDYERAYELNSKQRQEWEMYGQTTTLNRLEWEKRAREPEKK